MVSNEDNDGERRGGRGGGNSRRAGDALADDTTDGEQESEVDDDGELSTEDPLAHLPDYVISRVERLKEINLRRDEIIECYVNERAELEQKYADLMRPLYDERALIVQGKNDKMVADDDDNAEICETNGTGERGGEGGESSSPRAVSVNGENNSADDGGDAGSVVGIPQFWVCSMTQLEAIGELVTEEDVDCLEHLRDITCVDDENGKGFTLRFYFAPNEYFHDTVLTKKYEVPNLLLSDEPILKNVTGCKIQWKKDRSLTYRTVKKKQRGKGKNAGQVRTITKQEQKESFFHWFDPPTMPAMDEMDEEEAENLEETFDNDYDVAQAFRCHIIPKAVLWFTGQASDQEMQEAMEGTMEGAESAEGMEG